jgi:hypothetical protein
MALASERESKFEQVVHVTLVSEPIPVVVPVRAECLDEATNVFRLVEYLHPDQFDEDDELEFAFDTVVRCRWLLKDSTGGEKRMLLVAEASVDWPEPPAR